ncbi:MAG TPA: anthranilate synthase component I [Thermoanaerobaculia bacterium]|jgi:anthranilate synthase component 1|nr:anthranilate synthase component I [Thermoanaerobaculia bacterium]
MSKRSAEREALLAKAKPGHCVPVARVFPSDLLTPVMLFSRMRAPGEESFLLESVEGGEAVARYTFLGTRPVARWTLHDGIARLERDGKTVRSSGMPLAALERLVRRAPFVADPDLPPLAAGAVGFLTYDAVRLFEEIPDRHAREGAIPDALFLVFDAVAAFDHPRQRLLLLTTLDLTGEKDAGAEVDRAIERLDRLEANTLGRDASAPPARAAPGPPHAFEPVVARERFLEAVAVVKEAIASGEVYQCVLSQRWTASLDVDPFDVYRALRALNPSPYLYYLETREATVLGSSPEMLARCRDGGVETRPIAGTVPRGTTPEADARLAAALLSDPKERAEHVMLVDLSRNDLGRVCATGTVSVARYAAVEKFSHVQHLVSEVRGRLAAGRTAADALAACFPAGTLTGAPKIRAMELIDGLEACRRGVYGGAVGYFDAAGNCDMAIAIRTAVVEKGLWRIQAGAGIVADSVAENEYAEAQSKAEALFRAIDLARDWFAPGTPKPRTRRPRVP